jgi:hypothetical protein
MTREKELKTITEKRRNPRIDTSNIVAYILYDDKRNKIGHGKGRTINLSQTGTLLQTENKLDGAFIILVAIDLDGNKIKVDGKVISSRICKETGYNLTSIEFVGPKDKQLKIIVAFVKAYQKRKHIASTKSPGKS